MFDIFFTSIPVSTSVSSLGGIMMFFYYYTGWRRFVIISSEGDDYRSGAETVSYSMKKHTSTGFMIAHHYEEVRIQPTDAEIDVILENIMHEARGSYFYLGGFYLNDFPLFVLFCFFFIHVIIIIYLC